MENQIESEREERRLKQTEVPSPNGGSPEPHPGTVIGKKKFPQILNHFSIAMQQHSQQRIKDNLAG